MTRNLEMAQNRYFWAFGLVLEVLNWDSRSSGQMVCSRRLHSGEARHKQETRKQKGTEYAPFTSEVNLGSVVASRAIFLDAEIDFFLSVDARVGERGRSSIFPFDARSAIELNFSLYSGLSSFRDSVTPVRRREDTEGDGDAGVKVQID